MTPWGPCVILADMIFKKRVGLDIRGRGFHGKEYAHRVYDQYEQEDGTLVMKPVQDPPRRKSARGSKDVPDPDVTAALAQVGQQLSQVAEMLAQRGR